MANLNFLNAFGLQGYTFSSLTFGSVSMNASGTKHGVVFQAPTNEAMTTFLFRYQLRTGTPPIYKCGIQGVDASGLPDGTYKGGGSPASATFTPPATTAWDGTVQAVALANSYTPAAGDWLAWVIEYSSGTIDGSNFSQFTAYSTNIGTSRQFAQPYRLTNTAGWSKPGQGITPIWGYRGASNSYGLPIQASSSTTATSDGNRVVMRFSLPSGIASNYTVAGIRPHFTTPVTAAQSYIAGIWDSAGTVVQSVTLDSDYTEGGSLSFSTSEIWLPTPAVLTPGSTYYVGFERLGSNIALNTLDFAASGDLSALDGGTNLCLATWNGSAWTLTQTSRPIVSLILSDLTGNSGAAGMLYVPSLDGL